MPELPEVETVRSGLEGVALGKAIGRVVVNRYDLRVPVPQDFGQSITGKLITAIQRRGKYIIFAVGDVSLILHLGMSGRVRTFSKSEEYTTRKHDHVLIYLSDGACFVFEDPRRFGMFYYTGCDWAHQKPFASMGMEPLEDAWRAQNLYDALRTKKAPIKTALLDQSVVAGLGNIYVCEALYASHISPRRLSCEVNMQETVQLVKAVKDVLRKAIEAGGSTLRDFQHSDGSLGYFQYQFAVYDREGVACNTNSCGGVVRRIIQGGRSTFYCPDCQK